MIIGNFTYTKARNAYTGTMGTLSIPAQDVTFQPNDKGGEKAPDYKVIAKSAGGEVELGAAWKRTGENGAYLSIKLDDPALAQPFHCALVAGEKSGEFILVWSRDKGRKPEAA